MNDAAPPPHRSDVPEVVWPPIPSGDAARLATLLARLEETQWLPRPQLAAAQGRQLAQVVAHHARHTPSFAARLQAAGVAAAQLDSPERLPRLPTLRRSDVQAAGRNLYSRTVPPSHLPTGDTQTSGSTGEPVTIRRTAINRLFWAAFTLRDHAWHGRDVTARLTSIRPTIETYLEQPDWGFPAAVLHVTGAAQGIPSTVDIDRQLALIEKFQPATLIVFPTNLQAFVDHWERPGGAPPASLRHVRTVGETVPAELRARLAAATGLVLEDCYSSQEAGVIALQCPVSGLYHTMAESLIVEVLDEQGAPCADGEIGRVVVTDLHNVATPLIRSEIGDYAEAGGTCPCGRGLPTLRRIVGRQRNLLQRPDGTRHWPVVGYQGFRDVAPVQQFQVIQHSLQDIEVKVVTANELTAAQVESLAALARRARAWPNPVRITPLRERLPRSRSGKFEDFVSHL